MNFTLWLEAEASLFHVVHESGLGYRVGGHTRASLDWLRNLAGLTHPIVDTGRVSFRFEMTVTSVELLRIIARLDGSVNLHPFDRTIPYSIPTVPQNLNPIDTVQADAPVSLVR